MNFKSVAWRHCCGALAFIAASFCAHAADKAAPAVSAPSTNDVVATVNGRPISRAVYDELIKSQAGVPNPYDEETPEEAGERHKRIANTDRAQVLEKLVVMEALAQKARERGLDTQPDIVAEAELQYKTLLEQHMVRQMLANIKIDPAEIADRYAAQQPEQSYKVSHILLKDEASARVAIAALEKGVSFEKVARARSIDKQSKKDGSLGWMMVSQMDDSFAQAASALQVGEYTHKPVETTYGWHVIRVDGKRDLPKPSFENMRDILRTRILHEKVQAQVRQLMQETKIEVKRAE